MVQRLLSGSGAEMRQDRLTGRASAPRIDLFGGKRLGLLRENSIENNISIHTA